MADPKSQNLNPASPPAPADAPAPIAANEPVPEKKSDKMAAVQARAPHVDDAFAKKHGLDDDYLTGLADGTIPPPPYHGPDESMSEQYNTPGGWQTTAAGVKPEDADAHQLKR